MKKVKCPHCKNHPLEVRGTIDKTFEGEIDDKGFMAEPITHREEITQIECAECGGILPLSIIKGWG